MGLSCCCLAGKDPKPALKVEASQVMPVQPQPQEPKPQKFFLAEGALKPRQEPLKFITKSPAEESSSVAVEIKLKHLHRLRDHMYPATNCTKVIRTLSPSAGMSVNSNIERSSSLASPGVKIPECLSVQSPDKTATFFGGEIPTAEKGSPPPASEKLIKPKRSS